MWGSIAMAIFGGHHSVNQKGRFLNFGWGCRGDPGCAALGAEWEVHLQQDGNLSGGAVTLRTGLIPSSCSHPRPWNRGCLWRTRIWGDLDSFLAMQLPHFLLYIFMHLPQHYLPAPFVPQTMTTQKFLLHLALIRNTMVQVEKALERRPAL